MSLTFENPWFLWLLLLAIPVVITGLRWLRTMSLARAISAIIARVAVLALISFILAGAAAVRTSDKLAVIVVVDVSESVTQLGEEFAELTRAGDRIRPSRAIREFIDTLVEARDRDDLLGLVIFDGGSLAMVLPTSIDAMEFNIARSIAPGSDIAAALRFAETLFPPDATRRLILVSDGNTTGPDPVEAARELASLDTPVDVVPIAYRVRNEVMIEAVDTPPQASQGSTVAVRVVLRATDDATGRIRLVYEDEQIDISPGFPGRDRPVALQAGINTVVLEVPLDRERVLHRLRPEFIPDDPSLDRVTANNTAEAFTVTPGPGRVLIVQGEREADIPRRDALADTLRRADIALDIVPASLLPTDLLALQAYDLIVLQNVAAGDIPIGTQPVLADYVTRLGGGLIKTGGRDAFGAGGWIASELAEILPVELEIPDDIVQASTAVALVIDRSGSMLAPSMVGGRSQMEIATEAAALSVEVLAPNDYITVISFAHDARLDVPLRQNTEPAQTAARIRSIRGGGGTSISPALERAYQEIRTADASVKHIIFLTDGMDPSSGDAPDIAAQILREGITVSTIALGGATDEQLLQDMAVAGGGQYYLVMDPNLLPRLFLSEVSIARQPLIREQEFEPVVLPTGSPVLIGIANPPPANGLVLTQHRDEPTVIRAIDHPEGFPLLAHWFVGRGQVGVFTSDIGTRWTAPWLAWPGNEQFWRQFVRTISRPSTGETGTLDAQIAGDEMVVRYEAFDETGQPRDLLSVTAQVYDPDGTTREINLSQTGPGTYEARTEATKQGSYVVVISPSQAGRPLPPTIGGTTRALSPEFQNLTSELTTLQTIAEASGGRLLDLVNPQPEMVFDRRDLEPRRASMPIWPLLLVWCVALFLLDVATRRIAWDRLITRELAEEFKDAATVAVKARTERAAATVAALRRPAASSTAGDPSTGPAAPRREQPPAPVQRQSRPAPTAASEAEQAAESRAREQRRAELRRQTLARLAAGKSPDATDANPDQPPAASPPKDPAKSESSRSSLLDAKRRARSRYAEGEEN